MQCSIILHSQNEKQKKGQANAKTHFRTYAKNTYSGMSKKRAQMVQRLSVAKL